MLARVRDASPAVVLAGTAVGLAAIFLTGTAAFAAAAAPLLLAGPAVALVLALCALGAVRSASAASVTAVAVVTVLLLPVSLLGVSAGGVAILPIAALVLSACATAEAAVRLRPSARTAAISSGVGLVVMTAGAAYAGGVAFDNAGETVYGAPSWARSAITALVALALVGTGLGALSRRPGLALSIACAVGSLVLLALLGALLFIPFLIVPALLFAFAFTRQWHGAQRRLGLLGGVALGTAVPVLLVLALTDPLVDCTEGDSGANVWVDPPGLGDLLLGVSSYSSGSMSTSEGGEVRGSSRSDHHRVTFTCRDGRLVAFSLRRF